MQPSGVQLKARYSAGVTQYGLKPVKQYDFKNVTGLINYGRGTSMDNIDVRRQAPGKIKSAVSFDGLAVGSAFAVMGGFSSASPYQLQFCKGESAALRICIAKGESNCERENSILSACLGRVMPLRSEAGRVRARFMDWFRQNVSDNFTKPMTHRRHDWRHYFAQEEKVKRNQMSGKGANRRPKDIGWHTRNHVPPGFARRSRLPANK
jgi:hypothetical protein